ncbi:MULTISPECIES: SRPBCC family protein [unclassified Streptomyces]|uniref:SRPBCC family protein n=1 Tax=Streptomyces sp. NPDC049944 TaxID=3155657 RepID=UPI0021562006|nr:SRPBCC family protein [Streptomyces sp. SM10]
MRVRIAAVTASLVTAGIIVSAGPVQAAPALAGSTPQTGALQCRGKGVDPGAAVRYRSDILIKAPLRSIFTLQTDVEHWPTWQAPVLSMKRLDPGPLRKGSQFRWTTPAPATPTTPESTLEITSTIRQLENDSCIRWTGPAVGDGLRIDEGVHVWTFTEVRGGVRVRTEESWTGAQVEADVPTATSLLGAGLDQWLRELKAAAKAGGDGPCR